MCLVMEQLGIKIERQHHEVATAGQAEIDYRFDTLIRAADAMMVYKYVVKNVAKRHGKTAMFHAQAALRRQRLGHAHPPVALEEGQAALCRQRIRRAFADGALLHWRAAQARLGAVRHLQSDDQHLQAPGARATKRR